MGMWKLHGRNAFRDLHKARVEIGVEEARSCKAPPRHAFIVTPIAHMHSKRAGYAVRGEG